MKEKKEKKYSGYGYHGGGRPRKGSEARRSTLSIVCTESEKEKIKADAKFYQMSVSEYCTKKLLNIL